MVKRRRGSASRMRFGVDNSQLPISPALLAFARLSLFLCLVPLACHCSLALALALALFLSRRCEERCDATSTRHHNWHSLIHERWIRGAGCAIYVALAGNRTQARWQNDLSQGDARKRLRACLRAHAWFLSKTLRNSYVCALIRCFFARGTLNSGQTRAPFPMITRVQGRRRFLGK